MGRGRFSQGPITRDFYFPSGGRIPEQDVRTPFQSRFSSRSIRLILSTALVFEASPFFQNFRKDRGNLNIFGKNRSIRM